VFYMFSANAAPFEPNRAYSPFAVYTLLNHGGDFEAAAGALRAEGYGADALADARPSVDISGIMRMSGAQAGCASNNSHIGDCAADNGAGGEHGRHKADPGPMPDDMLRVPGFVSE